MGSLSPPLSVLMLTFCSGQFKKVSWFKLLVVLEPFTYPYPAPTLQVAALLDFKFSLFLVELSLLLLPSIPICIPSCLRASPFTQSLARSPWVVLDFFLSLYPYQSSNLSHQSYSWMFLKSMLCYLLFFFFFASIKRLKYKSDHVTPLVKITSSR